MPGQTEERDRAGRAARVGAAFLLCLGLSGVVSAQKNAAPADAVGDVTFRTGTELVQVDVIVQNGGKPVDNLTRDDFTLTDNGEPQTISVFNLRRAEPVAEPAEPLPPGVVTNQRIAEGRSPVAATVILLDFANTDVVDAARAIQQAIDYLEHTELTEYVALYSLNQSIVRLHDFTTDREELLAVLREKKAEQRQYFGGDSVYFDLARRAGMVRSAFFTLGRYLKGIPGRKKLVWIGGGVPMTMQGEKNRLAIFAEYYRVSPVLEAPIALLNDANVSVYPIDTAGLSRDLKENSLATMNYFADHTGGKAVYGISQRMIGKAIDQVMRDTEVTYTLGFYIPEDAKAGDHDVRVRLRQGGMDLRYRRSYSVAPATEPLDTEARFKTLSAWMVEPLDATGIVVRAAATPTPDQRGSFDVTIAVDPASLDLELDDGRWLGEIDVGVTPDTGKQSVGTHESIRLNLSQETYVRALQIGLLIQERVSGIDAKGRLASDNLRVGVIDGASGKVGSVRVPIALPE